MIDIIHDEDLMPTVFREANRSGDTSTKTGCVIAKIRGGKIKIVARGHNDFPHAVHDTPERRARPEKYYWTEHAERNAIYSAARLGRSLEGCTAYINWFPCMDCARALVQVGISGIVCMPVNMDHPKYSEDFRRAATLFEEAEIRVRFYEGDQR